MFSTQSFRENVFIYENPNCYAGILICWIAPFLIFWNSISKYAIAGLLILLYSTSARADLACAFLLLSTTALLTIQPAFVKRLRMVFWIEIFVLFAFVLIYPLLLEYNMGVVLDEYSQEHMGKQLLSGRNQIWLLVFESIGQSPVIGWGLSTVPKTLYGITLSCHNLFLQVALQEGIIGVLLLIAILYYILKNLVSRPITRCSITSMCVVFMILLHECFEISLTQNLLYIGLMMWFLLGLGLNHNFNTDSKYEQI